MFFILKLTGAGVLVWCKRVMGSQKVIHRNYFIVWFREYFLEITTAWNIMLSVWICSQQDSILVSCVPPACQLYVFWWLDRFSSEHIWTSLQWWPPDVSFQEVGFRGPMCVLGGRSTYYVTSPMTLIPYPEGQTRTCENITFPKLCLRAIINFGHVRRLQSDILLSST